MRYLLRHPSYFVTPVYTKIWESALVVTIIIANLKLTFLNVYQPREACATDVNSSNIPVNFWIGGPARRLIIINYYLMSLIAFIFSRM